MRHVFSFTVILLVLPAFRSEAQSKLTFLEQLEGDSVALYFNKNFIFTEKDCYDYVRQIRLTGGYYNGYFEDRSIDGRLLAKGFYRNGEKHGYFEIYHRNGNLFSRGHYENNKPVGIWEYFRFTGLPERVLQITDATILMMSYADRKGKFRVENGKGDFDGLIAGSSEFSDIPRLSYLLQNDIHAIGKIVGGKPQGRWIIPDYFQQSYYMERFDQGKVIKSTLASKGKTKKNKSRTFLYTFFLNNYLELLETLEEIGCRESPQYFLNRTPNDFKTYHNDLGQKIIYLINQDLMAARRDYYAYGDNVLTIRFSVDDNGRAYDYKLVSSWGDRFFYIARNSINKTVFPTKTKTLYFQMKISYAGGYRFKYNVKFTKRNRR